MNVQLPVAVGLSPGQPAITPLDPSDDAPGAFSQVLGALQEGAGDEPVGPLAGLGDDDLGGAEELASAPDGAPLLEFIGPVAIPADAQAGSTGANAPAGGALGSSLGVPVAAIGDSVSPHSPAGPHAALIDAGRAAAAPELVSPGGAEAGGRAAAGTGTLDAAPWFAVRANSAEARGQALARAVRPGLEGSASLATRDGRGGASTVLGSAAEVQAMSDGDLAVRAPDLVARAVTHNVARGAMIQGQRAQVELPNQVLAQTAPPPSTQPALAADTVEAAPEPSLAEDAPEPSALRRGPPAAATAARPRTAPGSQLLPAEPPLGTEAPGAPVAADAATASARVASATSAGAAADAALNAGRPTEAQLGQVAVPDGDHMELKVSDGERSFRLSVAREADGLNVELKAPREIVADLRALEPEVEAALAEDGYELASFDAQADDSQSDGSAGDADGGVSDGQAPSGADAPDEPASAPVAPAGQGRIINRLA